MWAAFNITGTGVVVANMDTGVDWLHPALAGNYRGCIKSLCQHATSWFDATDGGALYPQDGNGHGTHTMGTIAGQGGIGVAPGARWIATRVLNADGVRIRFLDSCRVPVDSGAGRRSRQGSRCLEQFVGK